MKSISTINHLILLLADAFKAMSVEVPMTNIERLAMLIHHSMDHGRRVYHTSTHLFELCQGMNPRQILAGLFHDIVYYQLDNGFPKGAEKLLKPLVRIENNSLVLQHFGKDDLPLTICSCLFDFKEGDTLPLFGGMNEFLSAIIALRLLKAYLPTYDLIAIAACIEATVPFRGADSQGRQFPEKLAERVRHLSKSFNISFDQEDISRLITDAVVLANRDVVSFSASDPGYFLSATWLLIEESNAPINPIGIYSIQEYRNALLRMERFLGSLNPEHVFHSFQNTPNKTEIAHLHHTARNNIGFAVKYIDTKIAAIALVEALALLTGGDCPISLLLGDIKGKQCKPLRADDFLPQIISDKSIDPDLLHTLEFGRSQRAKNDSNESPLTAYMCRYLGQENILMTLQQAKRMFSGELSPKEFLNRQEPELVRMVAKACANIALSRADALLALEFMTEN